MSNLVKDSIKSPAEYDEHVDSSGDELGSERTGEKDDTLGFIASNIVSMEISPSSLSTQLGRFAFLVTEISPENDDIVLVFFDSRDFRNSVQHLL